MIGDLVSPHAHRDFRFCNRKRTAKAAAFVEPVGLYKLDTVDLVQQRPRFGNIRPAVFTRLAVAGMAQGIAGVVVANPVRKMAQGKASTASTLCKNSTSS